MIWKIISIFILIKKKFQTKNSEYFLFEKIRRLQEKILLKLFTLERGVN